MKRSTQLLFSLVFIQSLLIACSNIDIDPPLSFDNSYVNQQILLRAPYYSNSYKTNDPINLELKYNSDKEIVFPSNYNPKIFERTKEEWYEIKEKPTDRFPSDEIVLSPNKNMPAVQVVVLFPELHNPSRSYQLRIYVIGNMKTETAPQKVAAFVDITLYP